VLWLIFRQFKNFIGTKLKPLDLTPASPPQFILKIAGATNFRPKVSNFMGSAPMNVTP
jgi:hypothetical protein